MRKRPWTMPPEWRVNKKELKELRALDRSYKNRFDSYVYEERFATNRGVTALVGYSLVGLKRLNGTLVKHVDLCNICLQKNGELPNPLSPYHRSCGSCKIFAHMRCMEYRELWDMVARTWTKPYCTGSCRDGYSL